MVMSGRRARRTCSGCTASKPVKTIRGRVLVWVHYVDGRMCPGSNQPPAR